MKVLILGVDSYTDYKDFEENIKNLSGFIKITKVVSFGKSFCDMIEKYTIDNKIQMMTTTPSKDVLKDVDAGIFFWDKQDKEIEKIMLTLEELNKTYACILVGVSKDE